VATITFYEKPGCKGNARQKALLAAAGHTVQAKSIKAEPWTRERLFVFLHSLPVPDWFNRSAPAVKAGTIRPESLSVDEALTLLLQNPLLVRRPLMEVGNERRVGFDPAMVDAWIGLNGTLIPEGDLEACQHGPEGHGKCGGHEDGDGAGEGSHGACGGH
jgi:nitrogenase-associated protein